MLLELFGCVQTITLICIVMSWAESCDPSHVSITSVKQVIYSVVLYTLLYNMAANALE